MSGELPFTGFVIPGGGGGGAATSVSAAAFPLLGTDGSAGAPTYSFASDPNTGMYSNSGDIWAFSAGGARNFYGASGYVAADGDIRSVGGFETAVNGVIRWGSTGTPAVSQDLGLGRASAGVLKVTNGGSGDGTLLVGAGAVGAPGIAFSTDPDTGFFQSSTGRIQLTIDGGVVGTWYSGAVGYYPVGQLVGSPPSSQMFGFMNLTEANTAGSGAPNIITGAETQTTFTNEGASAENYHTLPTAVAGYEFTFIVQDTDGIRITAATGDTIRPIAGTAASATGGFIRCATAGAFIRLQSVNATEWISVGSAGVWLIDT